MTDRLLETIPIGPRFTLELSDCSRVLTGDRWKVVVEARLEIALTPEIWKGAEVPEPSLAEMQAVLGDFQCFVQRRQRIFVDVEEKAAFIDEIITGIKKDLVPYLKHPAFVKRYLEKQYRQTKERRKWTVST